MSLNNNKNHRKHREDKVINEIDEELYHLYVFECIYQRRPVFVEMGRVIRVR